MENLVHPTVLTHLKINGAKRTMLRHEHPSLDTIALGSSHGDHSFNPLYFPNSFNLCCSSQDLNHSFLLYEHIVKNYPNIKNIVLYYSVFSPAWNMLKNASEKYISVALNELFELGIEYEDGELNFEFSKIRGKLGELQFGSNGYRGFLPNDGRDFFLETYGAENRANDHLRFNKSKEENLCLIKIILLAKHLKHKLSIVVPPVRSDYKKATGRDFNSLFNSLIEIIYEFKLDYQVQLVNGFDSDLFLDAHFGDYDHLVPSGKGAEILTQMIYRQTLHSS